MASNRDYRAEYRARLARGRARGLSRSQARGHPRAGEPTLRSGPKTAKDTAKSGAAERLEKALRAFRETKNVREAAKTGGVSPERLRRVIRESKVAKRKDGRWHITDKLDRQLFIFSEGQRRQITVRGFKAASLAMRHRAAVRAFLDTNDVSHLKPFEGESVTDTAGHVHPLETRPNVLYQLAAAGNEGFEQIYRLVI